MSIAVKYGYHQDASAFGALALPIDDSAIVNSRQEMFSHIDAFVNHKIEQMFLPLLGDLLMNNVRGYRATFTPIETMRKALLTESIEEDAERHMIAFLHEVQRDLPAAIETYKAEYPRYLLSTDPQTHANGKALLSEAEEKVLRGFLAEGTTITYATGPIGEYFRNFMQRCYARATTLLALSKRFDNTSYEQFSTEQFSRIAQVINAEVEGFKIEVVDDSEYYTVTLHNRSISLYKKDAPIYVAYEDLENVRLSSPYGVSGSKNVVKLTNLGDTAMVAKVGKTTPVESAIRRADYSVRTKVTTPSEHYFTQAQLRSGITFEEMQKPKANSLEEINLNVGDQHTLSLIGRFSGKFIEEGYTLRGVEPDKIDVVSRNDYKAYIITARKAGTTMFKIIARNPAGSTPLEVDVVVT